MAATFKILIVEDQKLIAQVIGKALQDAIGIEFVIAGSVAEATKLLLEPSFDLIILDHSLPDGHGMDVFRNFSHKIPQVRWLFCTAANSPKLLLEVDQAGIHGIVLKHSDLEVFVTAVREVMAGRKFRCAETSALLSYPSAQIDTLRDLSTQEIEILRLLSTGLKPKEIAATMALAPKTINNQLGMISRKLHEETYVGMVKAGTRLGVI